MAEHSYILYIEDERPTVRLVCEMLKLIGYEAVGVTSGEEGLALMRERRPDLLLLDLMMPQPTGYDIYREIKTDAHLEDIPVIVISARVPEHGRTIMNDLPPVDDYVTKPFDMERLTRAVKRLMSQL